jgi:hydrogenase-4 component F
MAPIWTSLIWLALLGPAAIAAAALLVPRPGWLHGAEVSASGIVLAAGIGLLVAVDRTGAVLTAGGLLRVDALSAYLLAVVGAVALTASWGGASAARAGSPRGGRYAALVCLFLSAMVLAVVADNLGVTWVAVEATTIATAFLVGYAGGRRALEAAWKYVVLGSVGVGIAFLGLVLLYAATRAAGVPTLSWLALSTTSASLDPTVTRVGLALAALGFATKAGLAPMHSWLPDAHSQAPAPVSGLMSGVLLAVAFGVILRLQALDVALLHGRTVRDLLLVGGLLSLLVAAALVLKQRDYKRLLAYSSIEHMGLLALAAAIGGPLAWTAMLLHLLGHGLAKASTFIVAGRILAAEGSSRVADVTGLLVRRPRMAVPFLAGSLALLGMPPSGLFFTEVALVVAGVQRGLGWAMAPAVLLLLVVAAGIGRHVLAMTLGAGHPADGSDIPTRDADHEPDHRPDHRPDRERERERGPMLPLVLALSVTAVIALAAWPLAGVLSRAVAVIGAGS